MLARALNAIVSSNSIRARDARSAGRLAKAWESRRSVLARRSVLLPDVLRHFVEEFDFGAFPQLDLEQLRESEKQGENQRVPVANGAGSREALKVEASEDRELVNA